MPSPSSRYLFALLIRSGLSRHKRLHTIPSKSPPTTHPSNFKATRHCSSSFRPCPKMHSHIEIISPGTHDSSPTLQLFFSEARYLFECGDGTQRLCTEYGIRHSKLRHIFLTSLSATSIGGLLGLALTVADAGKQSLALSAPQGLSSFFTAARTFYQRPSFQCKFTDINIETRPEKLPIPVLQDDHVTVNAVPVRSRRDIQIDTAFGAHYDCVAYTCRLRDIRGKFNPARAIELGVKKGPDFGLLQKGVPVTTEAGTVVTSQQVMSPDTPGPVIVIIPCPTLDHVQSVVATHALHPVELGVLSRQGGELQRKCVFIHLAPREVLDHVQYREWCDSFGPDVAHIPVHSSVSTPRTVFAAQAESLALLHSTVDKGLFPLPMWAFDRDNMEMEVRTPEANLAQDGTQSMEKIVAADSPTNAFNGRKGKWINADCRLRYVLSPAVSIGPDRSSVRPRFIEHKVIRPLNPLRDKALVETGEQQPAGIEMKTPAHMMAFAPGNTAVRFFGTGSAIPGKHRNVSGLMLDMFNRGGVLLDCGEGTWGQMVRHFGLERAKRVLCELKIIFISHMHADHHLGLLSLLHERTKAARENDAYRNGPQLVIIGPYYLSRWLEDFQALAKVPLQRQLPPAQRSFKFFDARKLTDPQAWEAKFFPDAFGLEVGCVEVDHCPMAYGVVIRDRLREWKVVYSGDTRPCDALAEMGKGATLAIHEATLENGMEEEAVSKKHSTTSEALEMCAERMGAWRTILTHFSQRYPKVPKLDEGIVRELRRGRACVAFDLMCVDFARLEELPNFVPAMRDCFPDEWEEETETGALGAGDGQ